VVERKSNGVEREEDIISSNSIKELKIIPKVWI